MLRKTFEEPGTRPLPHLRKQKEKICVKGFSTDYLTLFFVRWCNALTSRCSLQILHSHTARGRLLHCVPHLVHMFYTTGENKGFQLLAIYDVITNTQLIDHDLLCFLNFCVSCSRGVCWEVFFAL